ncbi:hypothetical protein ES703_99372 [subsurface metagenome]
MIIPVERVLIREAVSASPIGENLSCKELDIDDERVKCGEMNFPTRTIDNWGVFDHGGDFLDIFICSPELGKYGLEHFHADVPRANAKPLIDFLNQRFPPEKLPKLRRNEFSKRI